MHPDDADVLVYGAAAGLILAVAVLVLAGVIA